MPEEDIPYRWLSDAEWKHLMFTMTTQIGAILNPLRAYGQGVFVDGALEEIMKLIDLFSQNIRGKDIMVRVVDKPVPSTLEEDD